MKKSAFTLAEVLITLGIIGVVAAMTMPVIIANVQKNTLKNQFKKVYNTFSNAVMQLVAEGGDVPKCYYGSNDISQDSSECRAFYTNLATELNYVKFCNGNGYRDGCLPFYPKYYTPDSGMEECPYFSEDAIKRLSKVWILTDGSIMFTYNDGGSPVFGVDINGFKKPNKGGYDVFVFSIFRHGSFLRIGSDGTTSDHCSGTMRTEGGKTTYEMVLETMK